jgi:hypothetical protein
LNDGIWMKFAEALLEHLLNGSASYELVLAMAMKE